MADPTSFLVGMRGAEDAPASFTAQLRAGTRKNWLLTVRNRRELQGEILQTVLLLGVLFLFASLFTNTHVGDQTGFRSTRVSFPSPSDVDGKIVGLAVEQGPCPGAALDHMAAASSLPRSSFICFDSPGEMESRAVERADVFAGFVLQSSDPVGDAMQGRLHAVLRVNHTLLGNAPYADAFTAAPFASQINLGLYGPAPSAFAGVFASLQALLGEALLQLAADAREATSGARPFSNASSALKLYVKQFPVPAHSFNLAASTLRLIVPIYLTMIFAYQLRAFLQRVLEEKEKRLKELMRMAGLAPAAYWASWLAASGAKAFVLAVASTIVLRVGGVLPNADPMLLFVFMSLFAASTLAFGCVVAAIFSKAKTGTMAGMLTYLVAYLPTVLAVTLGGTSAASMYFIDGMSQGGAATGVETGADGAWTGRAVLYFLLSLLSPSAFAMGMVIVNDAEMVGYNGAQWSTLDTRFSRAVPLPLGIVFFMLVIDTALYTVLAWYLDQVLPQEFGVRKHPLFCCRIRRGRAAVGAAADPLMAGARTDVERAGADEASSAGGNATAATASAGAGAGASAGAGAVKALSRLRSRRPGSWDGTFADGPVESLAGEGWTAAVRIAGLTKVFPDAKQDKARTSISSLASCLERVLARVADRRRADGSPGAEMHPLGASAARASRPPPRTRSWRFRRSYQPLDVGDGGSQSPVPGEVGEAAAAGEAGVHVGPADLVAVDNLWFSAYEGQITALLGHNGAGKSTTISLLCGLLEASAGDAALYGRSLADDGDSVRGLLGVCPQQDTLFDKLSVEEHLALFAGLRGVVPAEARRRAAFYMERLGLTPKRRALAETLSGGQKRKLCVAMALIGEPRVLLLDEPTSGMDAASRRQVWALLEACKADRVTLLLTHDMAEAELLCDRIAIMSRGRLRVVGSALHLKSAFDLGYTLTLRLARGAAAGDTGETPSHEAARELVHRHVPDAALVRALAGVSAPTPQWALDADTDADAATAIRVHSGAAPRSSVAGGAGSAHRAGDDASMVAFTLPLYRSAAFPALLRELEEAVGAAKAGGGGGASVVRAFALAVTSLEEVFLKLAEEEDLRDREVAPGAAVGAGVAAVAGPDTGNASDAAAVLGAVEAPAASERQPTIREQARAVYRRRMLTSWRDKRASRTQILAPLLSVAVSIVFRVFAGMGSGGDGLQPESLDAAPLDWAAACPASVAGGPLLFPFTASTLSAYRDAGGSGDAGSLRSTQPWVDAALRTSPGAPWTPPPLPLNLTGGVPFGAGGSAPAPATPVAFDEALLSMFRARNATSVAALRPATSAPYSAVVLYNTSLTRSLPAALSSVQGALVRHVLGCSAEETACAAGAGLTTSVHPFPRLASEQFLLLGGVVTALAVALYTGMGFNTVCAVQAMGVVGERATRARTMQRLAGMRSLAFWLGTLAHDFVLYLPVMFGATVLLVAGLGSTLYGNFPGTGIAAYLVAFLAYGIACPPMAYFLSLFFTNKVTAQTFITMFLSGMHTVAFLAGAVLVFFRSHAVLGYILNVLQLFPPFSVSYAIMMVGVHTACDDKGGVDCAPPPLLSWDFLGSSVLMSLLPVPLTLALVVWADGRPGGIFVSRRPVPPPQGRVPPPPPPPPGSEGQQPVPLLPGQSVAAEEEDADVQAERAAVHLGGAGGEAAVVLRHMGKVFRGRSTVLAVRDMSLRMFPGECFGLLGPNGAGKTTSIRILTGDYLPSVGDASVAGHTVLVGPERDLAYLHTGCCPQDNALFEHLTVRENLEYYATLRGVAPARVEAEAEKAVAALGLAKFAARRFGKCSGGTQRRACLAASLLGRPRVVFLDEASTGLDPVARRRMWRLIRAMRDSGSLVVLTTHSMEEAEALCDRIGIMINGAIACLGTPGHLKGKYGTGFQLELSVDVSRLAAEAVRFTSPAQDSEEAPTLARVRTFVRATLGEGATLLESHGGHSRWTFSATGDAALSKLFQALEDARDEVAIRDYALSQPTLEQVFVTFARRQRA